MTTEMIAHQKVTTIIENVEQARQDMKQAFDLLASAKARLGAVIGAGAGSYYDTLWERDISCSNLPARAEEADAHVARNAWRYIIAQTGITHYMTERRKEELQAQLKRGDFPALTVANVLSTMEGLAGDLGTLLAESVVEVFNWLRPQSTYGVGALKTNKKWKVGYKVITGYIVDLNYGGGYRVRYGMETRLRALGNVFALLDGAGVPQYPHDLVTQLNEAMKGVTSGTRVSVPYMQAAPYKNGNLHLTFTRTDLVDALNTLGANGSGLPDTR